MRSPIRSAAAVAALLLGLSQHPAAAEETLRLGFMSVLSGPLGALGAEQRRGLDLAIADLGGKIGGLPVEVLSADDQADGKAANAAASKLIDKDKVDIITGVIASPALIGASKPIMDSGLLLVSANAGPSLYAGKNCNANFFFTGFQNEQADQAIGLWMNEQGYKKVFFLGFDNQAGYDHVNGAKTTFKGEKVGEVYDSMSQLDFTAEIAQIRAAKPDAVYVFLVGAPSIAFVKQYAQSGLKDSTPVVSMALVDATSIKAQGQAAMGIKIALPYFASIDNPQNKKFVAAFRAKYDREPSFYAADQYDAIMLIDSAVRAVGGKIHDRDAMRAAMAKADFKSLRGDFKFNVNHFPIEDFFIGKVAANAKGEAEFVIESTGAKAAKDPYYQDCKMSQ